MFLTKTIGVNHLNCNWGRSYTNKHRALFPRQLKQCESCGMLDAATSSLLCVKRRYRDCGSLRANGVLCGKLHSVKPIKKKHVLKGNQTSSLCSTNNWTFALPSIIFFSLFNLSGSLSLLLVVFPSSKMNSTPNLINPQRFHVLIPKVKGVIVLTNEVNVSPGGNTGTAVRLIETKEKRIRVRKPECSLGETYSRSSEEGDTCYANRVRGAGWCF